MNKISHLNFWNSTFEFEFDILRPWVPFAMKAPWLRLAMCVPMYLFEHHLACPEPSIEMFLWRSNVVYRCSSSVGRKGGMQTVHLGHGCKRLGTIMHEMMHVLGIIHEQSRPDRDQYLKINFANLKKGKIWRKMVLRLRVVVCGCLCGCVCVCVCVCVGVCVCASVCLFMSVSL